MAKLKIRDIRVSDKQEYLEMVESLFNSEAAVTDYDEEVAVLNFNNAISNSKFLRCLIFEYEGLILGYAFLVFSYSTSSGGMCLWLEDLYIKPQARRKGLGRYFFNWVKKEYGNEAKILKLEVAENNLSARQFYKSLEFKNSGYKQLFLFLK